MATVYFCGPNNSTFFTTCCHVAIVDEQHLCPVCREVVTPFGRIGRWNVAIGPYRKTNKAREGER